MNTLHQESLNLAWDVAVIGAGPAGLEAALASARTGARTGIIDQFTTAGGQYFMQSPGAVSATRTMAEGRALIDQVRAAGVQVLSGYEVFALDDGLVMSRSATHAAVISYRSLVIATGAHDRTFAFPGWTLPGVMTPGAGQRLVKSHLTLPGRRIVLAGSGVFLYAVAETILSAGGRLAGLYEARRPDARLIAHVGRHPERWRDAFAMLAPLARAALRPRFGWIVVAAEGRDRVEAVKVAPLGTDGSPRLDLVETIAPVDALLVGYGFRPSIETASVLGCKLAFDDALGGWHVAADMETAATNIANVFAAGEVSGVRGATPARLMGRQAGFSAAAYAGFAAPTRQPAQRQLARARAFGEGLQRLHPVPDGIDELLSPDTIVCRCEDVTAGELHQAVAAGASVAAGAKMWTRAGMGRCQGRICGPSVARIIARASGVSLASAGENRSRIPIRPVPLDVAMSTFHDVRCRGK